MRIVLIFLMNMISLVGSNSQKIKLEFIAMQYYGGFLNRSYVVQVSDSLIFCGRVRGIISAGLSRRYSKEQIEDPYFYADQSLLQTYHANDLIHPELLKTDGANFVINRKDISSVLYTKKKKWGMGVLFIQEGFL